MSANTTVGHQSVGVVFGYRDKGTIIHRLNPFCKLVWIGSVVTFTLIFDNPVYVLGLFLSTVIVIFAAGVVREWLSLIKLIIYLCAAIIIINALVSNKGSHILIEAPFHIPVMGTPAVTLEALFFGMIMCLRLLAAISAFAILSFTIHPDELMLLMMKLRLPYSAVLVLSLSTRFIPTLLDDVQRITDVQRSRGVEYEKGEWIKRKKSQISIVFPLLSNSLDRAVQVAEAMESRAFGAGKARTIFKKIGISHTDVFILAYGLLVFAFGISMRISGYGEFQYYPTIGSMKLGGLELGVLIILLLLMIIVVPLAMVKSRVDLD